MKSIPRGWNLATIGTFVERLESGTSVNCEDRLVGDGEAGMLKLSCVTGGRFCPSEHKAILADERGRVSVFARGGALLISRSNTVDLVGASALVPRDFPLLFVPDTLWQTAFREGVEFDRAWLGFVLSSPSVRRRLRELAAGTSGSMKKLTKPAVLGLEVLSPPVDEQRRIAAVIGCHDQCLVCLDGLLESKTAEKRGLMQQLLAGRVRFKEFGGERWRKMQLGDVVRYNPRPRAKPNGSFLSAGVRSHGRGVFLKRDFEAEDIALDELFVLRSDDLVVNITFGWEGAVAIVPPEADGALVSHRFPTFVFKPGVSFPGYFRHVIRQKRFVHEMGVASPGGAGRNRVLGKAAFLEIPVDLPSLAEQERIAAVLGACDREIELLQKELDALKEQKRGLMQKLLTGEVRVKV